jgi:hypothetical protein
MHASIHVPALESHTPRFFGSTHVAFVHHHAWSQNVLAFLELRVSNQLLQLRLFLLSCRYARAPLHAALSLSPQPADPPHRGIPHRMKRARRGVADSQIQIYWASVVNGRSPGNEYD